MICDECGETNKAGTEFCVFCGAFLGWQEQPNPPGANDVTEVLPAVDPAAPVASTSVQTNRLSGPPQVTQSTAPAPSSRSELPSAGPEVGAAPRHQPTPVDPVVRAEPAGPPPPPGCPACGRPVASDRRFCGHCGEQFVRPGAQAPVTRPTPRRDTWWTRLWDSKDRVARRDYRRSLPPLYRWRRVIIAVVTLGLVGAGLTMINGSPKSFVLARYYDVKKSLVNVAGVTASTIPSDASAADTTPQDLIDNSQKPWLMSWTDSTKGSPCGVTPTTPVIQLTFPQTRIRGIDMRAGIAKKYGRGTQFRPETIWVAYGNTCKPVTLKDLEQQPVPLDTKVPVDSLRIGVITAFPPDQPEGRQDVLGFAEITLVARPPLR